MKKRLFVLSLIALAGLMSCDEDTLPLDENCIEVRLVADICGQAVIQVLGPEADALNLGTFNHWENGTFDNVFGTFLDCDDMDRIPRDGSSFRIKIIEEPRSQTCAVCLALLADMPEQQYHMRIVDDCSTTVQ